jgi:exodeoxyribonuclease VII large subunit
LRTWLANERSRLRTAGERKANALLVLQARRRDRFDALGLRLATGMRANAQAHLVGLRHDCQRTAALAERGQRAIDVLLDRRFAQLESAGQLLAAFSYRGVLARGFALVRDGGGHPLRSTAAVATGMALDIEFSDGHVAAVAGDARSITPAAPPFRRRRRRSGSDEGQGNLFD